MMLSHKFLHRILKSNKGSGIVLVLVVCAFVGAAGIYVMNLGQETEKKIVLDSRVLSYNTLVENVRSHLHSGSSCTDLLRGRDISGAFNPNGQSIELDLKLKMNPKILRRPVGNDVWFVKGGTSVQDVLINVYEKVREPVRLDNSTDPPLVAAMAYVLIVPGHRGVGIKLERNKHYKIPIFLYYSKVGGSRIIHSCFNPAGDAYFCTVNDAAYDSRTVGIPQEQRCQPDRDCIPFNGSGIVMSQSACTLPYRATSLGFNMANSYNDVYWCNWCNRNALQPVQPTGIYYVPPEGVTPPEPLTVGPKTYPPVVPP